MANRILLTGAGFSANFGAPLAYQISDRIYNDRQVRKSEKLKNELKNNFDFEAIYQNVMQSEEFNDKEKQILSNAIQDTYERLDEDIIRHKDLSQTYADFFKEFLFKFSIPLGGSGFAFTLNQDLLIERRFCFYPDPVVSTLELPIAGTGMSSRPSLPSLKGSFYKRVIPKNKEFEEAKQNYENRQRKDRIPLSYVKLHGSQEWFTGDGRPGMVIGHGKSDQIKIDPLLSYYWNLFENKLNQPDTKLLIIGYGFKDKHVNDALASAKSNMDLEITVINRSPRKEIFEVLTKEKYDCFIDKYYENTVLDLFPTPSDSDQHPVLTEIQKDFFECRFP